MNRLVLCCLAVCAALTPALALDTLRGGGGTGQTADWSRVMASSRFVGVSEDSIWIWQTEPNTNLALGIAARDGTIGA